MTFYNKFNGVKKIFMFITIGLLFFLYLEMTPREPFYYDSGHYWNLKDTFVINGNFSFLHYKETLRGYAFPFILYVIAKLAHLIGLDEVVMFYLFSAAMFSSMICYLFPISAKLFNKDIDNTQISMFGLLLFYFWRGYFKYPLSDFVSLIFFILGFVNCLKISLLGLQQKELLKDAITLIIGIACICFAMLIRPIYQATLVILIFILIKLLLSTKGMNLKVIITLSILFGVTFGFGPQYYINTTNHGIHSPFVQTQLYYKGESFMQSLMMQQIRGGFGIQRFESYVGPDGGPPGVRYTDESGIILRKSMENNFSVIKSIETVFKKPLDFIAIYMRHLFNGLDVHYSMPYIHNMQTNRSIFSTLNYGLWFVFISIFLSLLRRKNQSVKNHSSPLSKKGYKTGKDNFNEIYSVAVLVTCVLLLTLIGIVGGVEVRFLLPLVYLCYAVVIGHSNLPFIINNWKSIFTVEKLFACILFVAFCFSLSTSVAATIQGHVIPNIH